MLDIGWSELAVIAVIALLVIGPKDLPRALYTVGKWMRAARKVTRDFQKHVDDMMREAELDEVRKGLNQVQNLNVRKKIQEAVDPTGELKRAFDEPVTGSARSAAAKPSAVADGSSEPPISDPTPRAEPEAEPAPGPASAPEPRPAAAPAQSDAPASSDKAV